LLVFFFKYAKTAATELPLPKISKTAAAAHAGRKLVSLI